jgi:hypothetical protein
MGRKLHGQPRGRARSRGLLLLQWLLQLWRQRLRLRLLDLQLLRLGLELLHLRLRLLRLGLLRLGLLRLRRQLRLRLLPSSCDGEQQAPRRVDRQQRGKVVKVPAGRGAVGCNGYRAPHTLQRRCSGSYRARACCEPNQRRNEQQPHRQRRHAFGSHPAVCGCRGHTCACLRCLPAAGMIHPRFKA